MDFSMDLEHPIDLSGAVSSDPSIRLPDNFDVDRIPSYLLELKFGEKLYADIMEAMTSSTSNIPDLIKSRDDFKRKLATFGVLGKCPVKFMQNEAYSDELLNIFRSRVTPLSASSLSEDHIENLDIVSASDRLIDRAPPRLLSEQLFNDLDHGILAEQSFKFPLPSTWSVMSTSSFKNSTSKLILTTPKDDSRNNSSGFSSSSPPNLSYKPSLAWTDKDVPVQCTIYYFEITILDGLQASDISVGFLYENIDKHLNQMPGLDIRSFGFNGKEGKIYSKSDNLNENFGLKFGINDVIGCGINRYTETIFYTKNGILLGDAFHGLRKKPLYPCIGMGDFISVKANFGLKNDDGNFLFDINNYVKIFKNDVQLKIDQSMVEVEQKRKSKNKRKNELKSGDIPEVLNTFVISHLNHSGYANSWGALLKDLKMQESLFENVDHEEDLEDFDEDLFQRDLIRTMIWDNEIDALIVFLKKSYKNLFSSNHECIFKLKCLKLINLIKNATSEKDNTLILKALKYGKVLKEEYKDDTIRIEYLNDISSLVAFEDPINSKFGYLLNDLEMHKCFEQLNKIILLNSNKDEFSIFERIINQVEVVLSQLVDKGDNEATLINLEQDYL